MSHSVRSGPDGSYLGRISLRPDLQDDATTGTPADESSRPVEPDSSELERRLFAALVGVVVLPFVVSALALVTREWTPAGDQAIQILRLEQVGTSQTPLLGAWSRWDWSHPGPWPTYVLAPFTWAIGAVGALVGTLVVNAASLVLAVAVGRRRGGLPAAALVALAGMLMGFAQGPTVLMDLWNPFVGLFPLYALIVVAWSISDRDWVLLPFMAGLASFCVQAHIGYLPVVVVISLTALVLSARRSGSAPDSAAPSTGAQPAWRRPLLLSAGVLVIGWLPPLLEQLSGETGNLTQLARYSIESPAPTVGWRIAWRAFTTELGLPGAWLTGQEFDLFVPHPSPVGAIVVIATVAILGTLAYRRGATSAGRLAVIGVVGAVTAFVATSRITGFPYDYLLVWWWAIGAAIWLSIGWSAWSLLARAAPHAARWMTAAVLVATAAIAVGLTVRSIGAELPVSRQSTAARSLIDQIEPALEEDASYLVEWRDTTGFGYVGVGVFIDLSRQGRDVAVPIGAGEAFDTDQQSEAADHRIIISTRDDDREFPPPPGSTLIARYDPLTTAERAEADALWRSISEQAGPVAESANMVSSTLSTAVLIGAGVDQDDLDQFRELWARGPAFVAYLAPL